MKVFYSNMGGVKGLEQFLPFQIDVLVSYFGLSKLKRPPFCQDLFLDSGAFSAFRKKVEIDLNKYAEFVHANKHELFVYASLDAIGNAQKTLANQKALEKLGLNPLPTYHFKEPWKYLDYYATRYDYIALGGVAQLGNNDDALVKWLDECWSHIRSAGMPRVHGFGIQNEKIMKRYPWFSVDATSVHMQARYGGIYTPWGWMKINPEVNPKETRWQQPINLETVRKWAEGLSLPFQFEEARAKTPDATLKRCVISIIYYDQIVKAIDRSKPTTRMVGML